MKIIVGQVVRSQNFWRRDDIIEEMWEHIEDGNHILLAAPRRVGKTSLMYKVFDEPKEPFVPLYLDVESADTQHEFWEKLFYKLKDEGFFNSIQSKAHHLWEQLKRVKIDEVSLKGVKFGNGETMDYAKAFEYLIKSLDDDTKLIIMLDEFAQTIENILKYETPQSAESLLKVHRTLRQNQEISQKVIFIYAGSIGLESIVARMDATKYINDLIRIKVPPLTLDEAKAFTKQLALDNKMEMSEETIDTLLKKIEWLIPFYIQLIMQELRRVSKKGKVIDLKMIDQAIDDALENRNQFEHWQSRLKSLDNQAYLFAKEVLNTISTQHTVKSSEIANLAVKHQLDEDIAKEIIHSLKYDGYINNNDNSQIYRFNSPILRMWWEKNVAH
jgi:AAA+ ATPase superfamily predicted ATPase